MSAEAPPPRVRAIGPPPLARPMGLPERLARSLAWLVALLVVSVACEIVGHFWCLWPTRRGSPRRVKRSNWIVRTWGGALFALTTRWLRAGMTLHGEVPPGRYVVVSNHQSTADIAILIAVMPELQCKFVAKAQLGWGLPSVSTALARMGGALIARRPSRRDIARLRRMGRELASWDGSAVVFAEGSRSRDGRVREYRTGALRLVAEEARLPLLPVAIDGTHVASDLSAFVRNMPGARVAMWIGTPVPEHEWRDQLDACVERMRAWAADRIAEGRERGLVPAPESRTDEGARGGSLPGEPA